MSDRIFVKIILSVNICSPCINFNLRNPIHTNQQVHVDLRQSCGFNSFHSSPNILHNFAFSAFLCSTHPPPPPWSKVYHPALVMGS